MCVFLSVNTGDRPGGALTDASAWTDSENLSCQEPRHPFLRLAHPRLIGALLWEAQGLPRSSGWRWLSAKGNGWQTQWASSLSYITGSASQVWPCHEDREGRLVGQGSPWPQPEPDGWSPLSDHASGDTHFLQLVPQCWPTVGRVWSTGVPLKGSDRSQDLGIHLGVERCHLSQEFSQRRAMLCISMVEDTQWLSSVASHIEHYATTSRPQLHICVISPKTP